MNFKFLLYGFLCGVVAVGYYLIHRFWLSAINKNQKAFFKFDIKFKIIMDWIIIIGLALASLVYLLESIGSI
jgi:hypothetical protein